MAKSDSFFIRALVATDGAGGSGYQQTSIDLGAYVDALGKSVLRIHSMQVRVRGVDSTTLPNPGSQLTNAAFYQLTTQSQSAIVSLTDKSVIASGILIVTGDTNLDMSNGFVSHDADILPQHYTKGYLVGVEQIYLAMNSQTQFNGNVHVEVILECTVETLSQSAAMALALSQQ